MTEKMVGYILLVVGVLTILFAALSVYKVFTGKERSIEPFNFRGISLDAGKILSDSLPEELSKQIENRRPQGEKSESTSIIEPALINEPLNITAHLFLMGFIVSVGYKLASLGTMLVRPIVVKLKTKEEGNK